MPRDNIDIILRLLNGRRFQAQLRSAGRSVDSLGNSLGSAAQQSSGLTQATNLAQGSLFGLAAAGRVAALGLGAATAATVTLGVKFNATMESNSIAFEQFAGGVEGSKRLTKDLFDIASKTPFSFEDITTAARRFLAFGYTVEDTKGLLKDMGDTLAFTGGGTDEILRVTKAFGDIQARGRLFQQEINQLTNAGIPAVRILTEELSLSQEQLRNIGKAGISSEDAIAALRRGMQKTFAGGQEKYLATFNGQLQRLKDNLSFAAGEATESSVFEPLKKALKGLNDVIDDPKKVNKFKGAFEGFVKVVGGVFAGAFLVAKTMFISLLDALKPAQPFLENVLLPLLKGFAGVIIGGLVAAFVLFIGALKIFTTILGGIGSAFGWVDEHLFPLKAVLTGIGIVLGYVFGPGLLSMLGKASKGVSTVGGVVAGLGTPFKIAVKSIRGMGGAFGWVLRKISGFLTKIPVIGVTLGNAFLKLGVKVGNFLFLGIKGTLVKILSTAGALVAGVGDSIRTFLNEKTPFGDTVDIGITSFKIPALATGGYIQSGGMALVGERGPEVVTLPRGAQVWPTGTGPTPAATAPMRPAAPLRAASGVVGQPAPMFEGTSITVESPIYIDRRQIGKAVGDYVAERKARR